MPGPRRPIGPGRYQPCAHTGLAGRGSYGSGPGVAVPGKVCPRRGPPSCRWSLLGLVHGQRQGFRCDPARTVLLARAMSTSITCPRCGRTSHNPNDVREGYCGACHEWTGSGFSGAHPGSDTSPPTVHPFDGRGFNVTCDQCHDDHLFHSLFYDVAERFADTHAGTRGHTTDVVKAAS